MGTAEDPAEGTFEIVPLEDLTGAEEASFRTRGLPEHPPLCGPEGQFFGHEWSRWSYDTLDRRLDQLLETRFPSGASILDLGCATGARAAQFARAGHDVTAVDIVDRAEEIQVRNAASRRSAADADRIQPITFVQADLRDASAFRFARVFDVVHARRVITFIPVSDMPRVLESVGAALRSGGLFVASFISTDVATQQMRTLRPLGPAPILTTSCPGLFGHGFSDVHRILRDIGLPIVEGFSDFQVEVGLIARKSSET